MSLPPCCQPLLACVWRAAAAGPCQRHHGSTGGLRMGPLHRHARLHSLQGIRGRSCKAQNYPLDGKKLNQLHQQQGETRLLTHSLLQRTTNVRIAGQVRTVTECTYQSFHVQYQCSSRISGRRHKGTAEAARQLPNPPPQMTRRVLVQSAHGQAEMHAVKKRSKRQLSRHYRAEARKKADSFRQLSLINL